MANHMILCARIDKGKLKPSWNKPCYEDFIRTISSGESKNTDTPLVETRSSVEEFDWKTMCLFSHTAFNVKSKAEAVKVWFQNRRTKYKRDRVREAEVRDSKAESYAACNILQMLQQHETANQTTLSPPFLPPIFTHPYTAGYSST